MKIISPFKDYYDWVAGKYGGGDPLIVYKRNKINGAQVGNSKIRGLLYEPYRSGRSTLRDFHETRKAQKKPEYQLQLLIFCGRQFLVIKNYDRIGDAGILSQEKYPELWDVLNTRPKYYGLIDIGWVSPEFYLGESSDFALQTCKRFDQPVLLLNEYMEIDDRIPVLQDLGFGSVMSAEQCYQEIAHFIGNVLRESPDAKPPVEVADKFKIIGAGFDTKTSFRHRK